MLLKKKIAILIVGLLLIGKVFAQWGTEEITVHNVIKTNLASMIIGEIKYTRRIWVGL